MKPISAKKCDRSEFKLETEKSVMIQHLTVTRRTDFLAECEQKLVEKSLYVAKLAAESNSSNFDKDTSKSSTEMLDK